tara:strand:+ start:285 stop:431 length:147 start_codon:yes stop_codon:yes gene_type:complete
MALDRESQGRWGDLWIQAWLIFARQLNFSVFLYIERDMFRTKSIIKKD